MGQCTDFTNEEAENYKKKLFVQIQAQNSRTDPESSFRLLPMKPFCLLSASSCSGYSNQGGKPALCSWRQQEPSVLSDTWKNSPTVTKSVSSYFFRLLSKTLPDKDLFYIHLQIKITFFICRRHCSRNYAKKSIVFFFLSYLQVYIGSHLKYVIPGRYQPLILGHRSKTKANNIYELMRIVCETYIVEPIKVLMQNELE